MATIGLCMIVKNEAHVIRRCLEAALPLIDHVLIVDTGSTDRTQDAIRAFLKERDLPGEVIDEPWRDFSYNRSFAMERLRECPNVDYGLMLDADNCLIYQPGFDPERFKKSLKADLYDVIVRTGGAIHHAPLLFSNRLSFRYKAVLHEYLESPGNVSREEAKGFLSEQVQDSARNRNPNKYADDAKVLEKALETETDSFLRTRYTFYLAQSYRDAGLHEQALEAYLRRSTMGGWNEEVFISLLGVGHLREFLAKPDAEILQAYLDAHEASPGRSEALHAAARFCRTKGRHQQSWMFAQHGLQRTLPAYALFAQTWVYEYGMLDEYAIAAYWVGRYRECFDSCVKLLKNPRVPADQQARIRQNALHAIDRLDQPELLKLLPAV